MPTVSAESGTQHRKVSTTIFLVASIILHLNDRPLVGNSATCEQLCLQIQCGTYRCHTKVCAGSLNFIAYSPRALTIQYTVVEANCTAVK